MKQVTSLAIYILSMIISKRVLASDLYLESYNFLNPLCDMEDRLTRGCASKKTGTNGLFPCVLLCNLDHRCVGASSDQEDNCFLHRECPGLDGTCTTINTNYRHVNKHCANGGTWMPSQNKCHCINGLKGESCETYIRKCSDLIDIGYERGIYTVMIDPEGDGLDPVSMLCNINPGTNTAYLYFFVNTGVFNFNKTWQEYRDGFIIDSSNRWAGLENVHRMTEHGKYQLQLGLYFGISGFLVRIYTNFKLSNQATGYKLTFTSNVDSKFGNVKPNNYFGNCLGNAQNIPFSTWDKDRDVKHNENCAAELGSGWWFSDCDLKCNLLGFYPNVPPLHPYARQLRVDGVKNETYQTYKDDWQRTVAMLKEV